MTTQAMAQLLAPLPSSAAPPLDTSDERLLQLDALAEKERFDLAAARVEELMKEGIYDIRPLPYYLYNEFVTGDAQALLDVLGAVENLVGPSASNVGPHTRREAYVNKRLRWLFEKVAASLAYQQQAKSERWRSWSTPEQPEVFAKILETGTRLATLLAMPDYPDAHSALGQILSIVRSLNERAVQASLADHAPAASGKAPPSTRPPPPRSERPAALQSRTGPTSSGEPTPVELLAAAPFLDLCQRLSAFEELVQREQLDKAAVVAADIDERISQFDPRTHFPALFATFVGLQSKHVTAFTRYAESTPPHVWRALRQFYLVDLKGFTDS